MVDSKNHSRLDHRTDAQRLRIEGAGRVASALGDLPDLQPFTNLRRRADRLILDGGSREAAIRLCEGLDRTVEVYSQGLQENLVERLRAAVESLRIRACYQEVRSQSQSGLPEDLVFDVDAFHRSARQKTFELSPVLPRATVEKLPTKTRIVDGWGSGWDAVLNPGQSPADPSVRLPLLTSLLGVLVLEIQTDPGRWNEIAASVPRRLVKRGILGAEQLSTPTPLGLRTIAEALRASLGTVVGLELLKRTAARLEAAKPVTAPASFPERWSDLGDGVHTSGPVSWMLSGLWERWPAAELRADPTFGPLIEAHDYYYEVELSQQGYAVHDLSQSFEKIVADSVTSGVGILALLRLARPELDLSVEKLALAQMVLATIPKDSRWKVLSKYGLSVRDDGKLYDLSWPAPPGLAQWKFAPPPMDAEGFVSWLFGRADALEERLKTRPANSVSTAPRFCPLLAIPPPSDAKSERPMLELAELVLQLERVSGDPLRRARGGLMSVNGRVRIDRTALHS